MPGLFIVASGVNDSNYGLEETVAVPVDLDRAVGHASLVHATAVQEQASNVESKGEQEDEFSKI